MSRVFLATEVALGRKVVVKVPRRSLRLTSASSVSSVRSCWAARLRIRTSCLYFSPARSRHCRFFHDAVFEGESLRMRLGRTGELPLRRPSASCARSRRP